MPSRLLGAESLGQVVLQGLVDFLRGLGASRLMAMIADDRRADVGFFAFVIMRVTTPQMTTLFTDLSLERLLEHHSRTWTARAFLTKFATRAA